MVASHRGSWGGRRHDQGHVCARTEETWYARKCRDGSVLQCPSLIVPLHPAGMALLQPSADRARFWRHDAGGGSSLSPVSGDGTERHAQAISGAVCRVLWSWNNWGMSRGSRGYLAGALMPWLPGAQGHRSSLLQGTFYGTGIMVPYRCVIVGCYRHVGMATTDRERG
jgi:hypothetical protein